MKQARSSVRSTAIAALIATAVAGLSIGAFCTLEYYYAKYYFDIRWRWYEISYPWNNLSFAFRYPESESTLLISMVSGVCGATVWWSMTRLAYSLGVAFSLLGSFLIAYVASLIAWSGTFSELLLILASQAFILTAFFTLTPRWVLTNLVGASSPATSSGPRFTLRNLLILPIFISVFAIVVRPAVFNDWGHINLWLPTLGASTGIVALLFLSSCHAKSLILRAVLLAICASSVVALGYCLASAFPELPVLWRFYTGSYAVGTFSDFPPAYMVWFVLAGLVSILTLSCLRRAEALGLRAGRNAGWSFQTE